MSPAARRRDRRVYLGSHPVLFALLSLTRRWPALRLGRTVLVHDREALVAALTRLPLDRTANGTTGGAADRLAVGGMLFDQQGPAHRRTRRETADLFGTAGVARLRPLWQAVIARHLAPLAAGAEVDLVPLAAEVAGTTSAALIAGLAADRAGTPAPAPAPAEAALVGAALAEAALVDAALADAALAQTVRADAALAEAAPGLAEAALAAGAAAARGHLPGLRRRDAVRAAQAAAGRLTGLLASSAGEHSGVAAMLAVAAVNTTVAALPRAAAWAADDDLWDHALNDPSALAVELLRVTAPSPVLPRVAAAAGHLPVGARHSGRPSPFSTTLGLTSPATSRRTRTGTARPPTGQPPTGQPTSEPRATGPSTTGPSTTGPSTTGAPADVLRLEPTAARNGHVPDRASPAAPNDHAGESASPGIECPGERRAPAAGCPVRAGDRLLLVARHAAGAHAAGPDPLNPAPPHIAQLVFGVGPHACPGAHLARAQLAELLTALAPYRPVVVTARVDRRAALPAWRRLTVRATR